MAFADRLAHLLPASTSGPGAPGARALLAEAEQTVERGLHVARGIFWAVLLSVFIALLPGSGAPWTLAWVILLAVVVAPLVWWLVWTELSWRLHPPRWLPYALVALDAWMAIRGPVSVRTPFYAALGFDRLFTPADLATIAAAILAALALSGAFRIDPRLSVFSTVVALLSWAIVAVVVGVSRDLGLAAGAVIGLTGVMGVWAARALRRIMLGARERDVLAPYIPVALTRELARTGDPRGAGRESDVTVLLVDMRGYTHRVERMRPRAAVGFLNDYLAVVVPRIAAEGGVIDKYLGDGVLAFFEADGQQHRAVRAARAILDGVAHHNQDYGFVDPIKVGIALHAGAALVGTIGAAHKREYTVIADVVNVTARLEELNKTLGSSLVASAAVVDALAPAERAGLVGPEEISIRGRDAPLAVYRLPATR